MGKQEHSFLRTLLAFFKFSVIFVVVVAPFYEKNLMSLIGAFSGAICCMATIGGMLSNVRNHPGERKEEGWI
jgi:hypothetical protein